jgi:hypothetical protein
MTQRLASASGDDIPCPVGGQTDPTPAGAATKGRLGPTAHHPGKFIGCGSIRVAAAIKR